MLALLGGQAAAHAGAPAGLRQESPCQPVTRIVLEGDDAARFGWLSEATASWVGRCLDPSGIERLVATLDDLMHGQGYLLDRVLVPPQSLEDGELRLYVHAVRVGKVRFLRDDAARSPDRGWGTWRNAFPIGPGDLLNVRDLEQGIEQMQRVPGQTVGTELAPGARADQVIVDILRQPGGWRERLRGVVTLDNSGSRALGRSLLSAQAELAQPLGLSDLLAVSGSTNAANPAPDHRSQALAVDYSIPWGYHTFTFSKSHSRFAQMVQGTTTRFLSSGRSQGTQLRWHYRLLRAGTGTAGLFVAASTRRARSFIEDVELEFQRHRTTNLEAGLTGSMRRGGASADFELAWRRGMPWRDAQPDLPSAQAGGPTLRPRLWRLSGGIFVPFSIGQTPLLYGLTLRAQHSSHAMLAIDQIGIGNRYTVRGFDGETVLQGENGYFVRNEWSLAGEQVADVRFQPYAGLDAGRVWGPSAAGTRASWLAGAILGVRVSRGSLHADLALGTPLRKPAGFPAARWNAYLSVSHIF